MRPQIIRQAWMNTALIVFLGGANARSSSYAYDTRTSCCNGFQSQLAAKAAWSTAAAPKHPEDDEQDNEDSNHNDGNWPTCKFQELQPVFRTYSNSFSQALINQNKGDRLWPDMKGVRLMKMSKRTGHAGAPSYEETEFSVLYQLAVLRQVTMGEEFWAKLHVSPPW